MSERGERRLVYGGVIVMLIGMIGTLATLILAYDVGILFLFLISMGVVAMISGARMLDWRGKASADTNTLLSKR
jgi:hypothetical protein